MGNYATAQISTAMLIGRDLRRVKHGCNERCLVLNANDTIATLAMDFTRSLPSDVHRLAPSHEFAQLGVFGPDTYCATPSG